MSPAKPDKSYMPPQADALKNADAGDVNRMYGQARGQ